MTTDKPYAIKGVNAGSGQRPFKPPFLNMDIQFRDHEGVWPDVVADMLCMPFPDGCMDYVVSHHTLEHLYRDKASTFVREANRVLKLGGSLIVCIPDIRALAQRWLTHQIDDYIYTVNMVGAYMGNEADIHKWHYTFNGLKALLEENGKWSEIKRFDNRQIPSADIAVDWWIMITEAIK